MWELSAFELNSNYGIGITPGYHWDKPFSGATFKLNASDSNIHDEKAFFPEVVPTSPFPSPTGILLCFQRQAWLIQACKTFFFFLKSRRTLIIIVLGRERWSNTAGGFQDYIAWINALRCKPWDFTVLNSNRNNLSLCKFGTIVGNGVSLKRKVLICSNISLAATLRATHPFMKTQEASTLFPLY